MNEVSELTDDRAELEREAPAIPAYLCTECQWVGNREDCHSRREEEHDGFPPPYRVSVYDICPDCGGEEFEEVTLCPDCKADGIDNAADDDRERCAEHAAEHLAEDLTCMAEDISDRRNDR